MGIAPMETEAVFFLLGHRRMPPITAAVGTRIATGQNHTLLVMLSSGGVGTSAPTGALPPPEEGAEGGPESLQMTEAESPETKGKGVPRRVH